jgi:hypothetical protein
MAMATGNPSLSIAVGIVSDASLLSSPEPGHGGGEAERERDQRFHTADLCGA